MKEHCLKALWLCRCVQACLMLGDVVPQVGGVRGVEISLHQGPQQKRVAAAFSQVGRSWPNQPIRAIQPAGRTRRPPTGCTRQTSNVRRQTDRHQTASSLDAPWAGHNKPPQ